MKLLLHIILKDLRRHWPEVGAYFFIVVAWTHQQSDPSAFAWLHQREFIPIFLFALWFLVVIRAIQGESLVATESGGPRTLIAGAYFWWRRFYSWCLC